MGGRWLFNAIEMFYSFTGKFYDMLMGRFDRTHKEELKFDDFVQLCVVLQTLTATFKEKDRSRTGVIRIRHHKCPGLLPIMITT